MVVVLPAVSFEHIKKKKKRREREREKELVILCGLAKSSKYQI